MRVSHQTSHDRPSRGNFLAAIGAGLLRLILAAVSARAGAVIVAQPLRRER